VLARVEPQVTLTIKRRRAHTQSISHERRGQGISLVVLFEEIRMKTKLSNLYPAAMFLSILASAGTARAVAPNDPNTTARTLVEQCAGIQKGDKVMVSGRPTDIALLESLAVQVRKVGAFPLVSVNTDQMARRMFDEVPAEFDTQTDAFGLKLAESTDALITVESIENPALFAGASQARMAARAKASMPVIEALLKKNVRQITLGNGLFPTQAAAKMYGLTTEQLSEIFWSGVNVDYSALQSTGTKIKGMVESGKQVHITNPNGTDLSFGIERRQAFVSDGAISKEDLAKGGAACQVWLPAGEVYSTPVPGTTSGRIVFDRVFFEGKEITGVTIDFKNGKVTSMSGGPGFDAIKAQYDAAGQGKDEFALFDIGINPAVKLPAGTKLLSWVPAGMVSLGIGGNVWAGGTNDCAYGFTGFVPGSTVTIDGKPLVEKGSLLH
jgi:leucyl aminopeptidase (aminopeptidase T)